MIGGQESYERSTRSLPKSRGPEVTSFRLSGGTVLLADDVPTDGWVAFVAYFDTAGNSVVIDHCGVVLS